MNLFPTRKHESSTAVLSTADLSQFPELWIPEHLAPQFPASSDAMREVVTPLSHSLWHDNLPGELTAHIRAAVAFRDYDGKQPGSVARPAHSIRVMKPIKPGSMVHELAHANPEDLTSTQNEQRELYAWSERHRAEYAEAVTTTLEAVLADPGRSWAAYLHLRSLEHAARVVTTNAAAVDRERRRLAVEQCPVCGDSDRASIGSISVRLLLNGGDPGYTRTAETLRSCHLCWEYAHDAYLARHAATSAGTSRAELVAAALSRMEVGS